MQIKQTKQLQKQTEAYEYQEKTLKSLASLSHEARHALKKQVVDGNILASVAQMTIKMKQAEITLEGEALKRSVARRTTLEGLSAQVMKSAEELGATHHKELTDSQQKEKFLKTIIFYDICIMTTRRWKYTLLDIKFQNKRNPE